MVNEKFKHFSEVAIRGKIACENSWMSALLSLNTAQTTTGLRQSEAMSSASWLFAHVSENALKSFLIYTDFIRMPIFTHTGFEKNENYTYYKMNGTSVNANSYYPVMDSTDGSIWRRILSGTPDEITPIEKSRYNDPRLRMIGTPYLILREINNFALPGDFRTEPDYVTKHLNIDSNHQYDFTKTISGHDLFCYFKLQAPEIQLLINNNLFFLGENFSQIDKIIAVLSGYCSDIYQDIDNQKGILANNKTFPIRRFDWISGKSIDLNDLNNIKDFANINLSLMKFKFPDEDLMSYILKQDYSSLNNTIFNLLDPVLKYYLTIYFKPEEINIIDLIVSLNHLNQSDCLSFITMCIYYKYYIKEIYKDKSSVLDFDFAKGKNLYTHIVNMKKYDANGFLQLENSPSFHSHVAEINKLKKKIDFENGIEDILKNLYDNDTFDVKFFCDNEEIIIRTLFDGELKNNPKYNKVRKKIITYYLSNSKFLLKNFINCLGLDGNYYVSVTKTPIMFGNTSFNGRFFTARSDELNTLLSKYNIEEKSKKEILSDGLIVINKKLLLENDIPNLYITIIHEILHANRMLLINTQHSYDNGVKGVFYNGNRFVQNTDSKEPYYADAAQDILNASIDNSRKTINKYTSISDEKKEDISFCDSEFDKKMIQQMIIDEVLLGLISIVTYQLYNKKTTNIIDIIKDINKRYPVKDIKAMTNIILRHGDLELFKWMLDPLSYQLDSVNYDFFIHYLTDDDMDDFGVIINTNISPPGELDKLIDNFISKNGTKKK